MKKIAFLCAALAATTATPALAGDIGAFGSAGFDYGTLTATGFDAYQRFAASNSACLGIGACARGNDTYAIIAATSSPDKLLVHPGPGFGGNSAISYTAATAGLFNLRALVTSADVGTKTAGYFTIIGGLLTVVPSGNIMGSASQSVTGSFTLGAGDRVGVFVNNFNGDYYNDSTLVSGSIAAVPEPASWGLMILGFGVVGASLRRRKSSLRTSVRFA